VVKLFGIDIAKEVASGISAAGGVLDVTFTNYTRGTRSATQPTAGISTSATTFTAKGFVDDYTDRQIDGTQIQRGDRRVSILGGTISPAGAPQPGARVEVVDGESEVLTIVEGGVQTDPARALFVCQCRES